MEDEKDEVELDIDVFDFVDQLLDDQNEEVSKETSNGVDNK